MAPQQASRFNPIYMETGSTQINCTKDLQTLYPNSFDRIGDMSGEYDIKLIHKYHLYNTGDAKYQSITRQK